jgi:hypothetical protein
MAQPRIELRSLRSGASWWRDPKLLSKRYVLAMIAGRADLLAIKGMRSPHESRSGLPTGQRAGDR